MARDALERAEELPPSHAKQSWLRRARICNKALGWSIRRARRDAYRDFIGRKVRSLKDTYKITRQAEGWRKPRNCPHLSHWKVDGKEISDGKGMSTAWAESTFQNLSGPHVATPSSASSDSPSEAPKNPPQNGPRRAESLDSLQQLREDELINLIKDLEGSKAPGEDEVGNRVLQTAREVLMPYLEPLSNACLALSYHPMLSRQGKVILLSKANKKSYDQPRSWRPIALLSSIDKLLEKVIANRLKDLVVNHDLLSPEQHGAPGKCTAGALQNLVDSVYTGWCLGLKSTLLCLDMTGAYNSVIHHQLLEILREKGIPP